jgi:hypothetical protein
VLGIGSPYLGGKIAYIYKSGDPGYDANVPHGLIAATEDQDDGSGTYWCFLTTKTDATDYSIGGGVTNTDKVFEMLKGYTPSDTPYAASLSPGVQLGGGYTDWSLPSYMKFVNS